MIIAVIVPVCEYDRWINFSTSAMKHCLLDDRFVWSFNFNGPILDDPRFTGTEDLEFIDGATCFFQTNKYDLSRGVPIAAIMQHATLAAASADYYLRMDDDFIFSPGTPKYPMSSGDRYIQAANFLAGHPECGVIKCDAALGGNYQRWNIRESRNAFPETKKGCFIKNVNQGEVFEDAWRLVGAGEDLLAAYIALDRGLFYAKQFNNPTKITSERTHLYEMRPGTIPDRSLAGTKKLADPEVWESNILAYIQNRWEPGWLPRTRRWPKGLGVRPYEGEEGIFSCESLKEIC